MKSFHIDSRAYVRVGTEVSGWFPVNIGLREGCVMSPYLFNLFVYSVVRDMNAMVPWKGLELLLENDEIKYLLFTDKTVMYSGAVCERRK